MFLSDQGALQPAYREVLAASDISFEEGRHSEDRVLAASEVVKSPGIPDKVPIVRELYRRKIPVLSEIEFAARYTGARLVAITGSNGKTTTTLLTHHLLREAGLSVGLAGNIGDSFARQVSEGEKDFYVLEISSFQLDNMYDFRASVAVLLKHHARPPGPLRLRFPEVRRFQVPHHPESDGDRRLHLLCRKRGPRRGARQAKTARPNVACVVKKERRKWRLSGNGVLTARSHGQECTVEYSELPIKGPHNAINALSAMLAAQAVGLTAEQIRAGLRSFVNAPHRLESVATLDGVEYVNDSKATNVDSVFYALGSFDRPVVLIIGGVDKGNDYAQIEPLVRQKVRGMVALGTDTQKLGDFFGKKVPHFHSTQNLKNALQTARSWAQPGDVVLLSPACASFDLFKNYQDRGEQFKREVKELALIER